MEIVGILSLVVIFSALGAVLYVWWQKFISNKPDRYGKGPKHELRGSENNTKDIV